MKVALQRMLAFAASLLVRSAHVACSRRSRSSDNGGGDCDRCFPFPRSLYSHELRNRLIEGKKEGRKEGRAKGSETLRKGRNMRAM